MDGRKDEEKMASRPLQVEGPDKDDALYFQRRRRRRIICCGVFVAVLVLIIVVFVILAVTLSKPKDPKITVNSVKLEHFDFKFDTPRMTVDLNVSLHLDLSIKNPNKASFKFGNSTTYLYYRGTTVGEALIPAGKISADRTIDMMTSVTIIANRLISNSNLLGDVISGSVPLSTSSRISGRVNVLNIFKHHAVSYTYCNITISISSRSLQNQYCTHSVKL
eukprot:Gb_05442 [translate_table: standard]